MCDAGRTEDSPTIAIEMINNRQEENGKKNKSARIVLGAVTTLVTCVIGYMFVVAHLPIAWDAGACTGGYTTYIFDKYQETLLEEIIKYNGENAQISNIQALRGTQEAEWEGQGIYMKFDVQYERQDVGVVVETLEFVGERKWTDTFEWRRVN